MKKTGSPSRPNRSVEKERKSGVKTKAHCQMFTNLPGQSCPLCHAAITPNVGHSCSIEEEPA